MPRGKKICPECSLELGIRKAICNCGYTFPIKAKKIAVKKPKKKKEVKKKINKREVLFRLVEKPPDNKKLFFMREMKILNDLSDKYSLEFLSIVNFGKKFKSLGYFLHEKVKEKMDMKWRAFNYKVDKDKYPLYNIGDKSGEDIQVNKKNKTTKDFLNE